ncbi:nucleosome assembly protein 1-like 4-like isoform 2 [Camelus ferus]|nr:nucleosome assembly protein 1-like 4-like isoform 2 [Camelus ferus]
MADNREEASVLAVLHSGDNGDTHPPVLFSGPGCPPSKAELRPLHTGPHVGLTMLLGLPKAVKRRINALKQLQVKCAHIEAKFYEEVHDLERKYAALYQPLFDKRREFVTGDAEPTDAESEWHSENEEEDKLAEYDEPILKHLQDIKVKFSEPGQPMSFVLEFHFEPNDYFTNSVLTKTYKMKSEPDKADPFSFEGPEIVDCDGCTIDWKKGKNVTVKTIKKKQKHKGRGTVRTITKQVPNDSFFNFFNPLKGVGPALRVAVPFSPQDEDSEFTLASDFEIGHFFRERIVPRAVLYFTGEAVEDDDNFEEGEEGEEEELEGDEEGEDEDDAEINPKHQLCLSARSRHGSFLKVPNKHCFGRGLTSTFIFSEPACPFRHGHACAQFPSEDRQGSRGGPPAPALLWVQRPGRRCMCPPSALTHGAGVGSGVEAEAEVVGPVHSRRSVQSVFPRSSYRQRVLRSSVSCFLPSVLLLCCPLAGPSVSSHI